MPPLAPDAALLERLAFVVRTLAGRPDLRVATEVSPAARAALAERGRDADGEWFTAREPDTSAPGGTRAWVHAPAALLGEPEDVAMGRAAHEAGHVAITRHGRFVTGEVLEQIGFHALLSSAEERAADRLAGLRLPGAGEWISAARRRSLAEDVDGVPAREALGELPRFLQLCSAVVLDRHLGEETPLAPEVVAVLDSMRPDLEALEQALPAEGATEDEVRAAAVERYRIVHDRLWPRVRPLVDQDLHEEALRRLLSRQVERASASVPPSRCPRRLDETWAALPLGERQQIEAEARAALGEAEDLLTAELDGGLDEARPESHADRARRREREGEEARAAAERAEAAQREAGAVRTAWDEASAAVRGLDEDLTR